jgi:hypothetical protein
MAVVLCVALVIALIVAADALGVLHGADPDFKEARAHRRRVQKLRKLDGRNQ